MKNEQFIKSFKVPEEAFTVLDKIVCPEEIAITEAVETTSFNLTEALNALNSKDNKTYTIDEVKNLLINSYKRGILELEDESYEKYKIGSFYTRLDIFAITEPESYKNLDREIQIKLDKWYFQAFLDTIDNSSLTPTQDKTVTLNQAIEFLNSIDKPIWLNRCDCRTLAGNCDYPTDVCISFRNGINTFSHRGWSKPINKQEAVNVLKRANNAGLMHTINPNSICNCCGDCCYLFRAQKALNSNKTWPITSSIALFSQENCVECGICTDKCHFNAFSSKDGEINFNSDECRGCGVCVSSCPTSSIKMTAI